MNMIVLSGIKTYGLMEEEHVLHLCFQITVQKCNQSAGQLPRHISPIEALLCRAGQGVSLH